MRKLLLNACLAAAACWTSDVGAMSGKTVAGQNSSITECKSRNNRFLMINRWELGDCSGISDYRYLHIDYNGTERKFEKAREEVGLTREMRDVLCTLPRSIGNLYNLKILNVCSFTDRDFYLVARQKICLKVLPDSIGNLKNLRILDLSHNDLRTLPDSIGDLKNLEELDLSSNYSFSKLPDSIGNLEKLEKLDLKETNLESLPESMGNLTNLEDLCLSRAVTSNKSDAWSREDYEPDWYRDVINRSLRHWSYPPLDSDARDNLSLNLSGKNLKQIPFGVYMMKERQKFERDYRGRTIKSIYVTPALEELDVSNNQLTEIPHLLKRLGCLKKLYVHNNPNLNHLPDFLWSMWNLKELKIDGKLIRDLPENARVSLSDKNLEEKVLDLTLAGKNKAGMSDQDLSDKTGPYTVYLKK